MPHIIIDIFGWTALCLTAAAILGILFILFATPILSRWSARQVARTSRDRGPSPVPRATVTGDVH